MFVVSFVISTCIKTSLERSESSKAYLVGDGELEVQDFFGVHCSAQAVDGFV